ncbi:MAG TPA: TetR/AcrR family transcriptional regulator [Gammaproteobacteria bacterium]|nr:TetR/AcrR family transcriptional regulator [Gammaproteobacteria bacterium]
MTTSSPAISSPEAPRNRTRDNIVALAVNLIQERGFNAFSYQHIAAHLGIRKAAVHYHFPAKADLGVAVVEHYRRLFDDWREEQRQQGAGPVELLRGYMAISLHFLRNGGKACPLGVMEAEFPSLPEVMCKAVSKLDTDLRAFVAGILEDGRRKNVIHFDGPPADKALVVTAALQGGLHIARAAGARSFARLVRQLETDLGLAPANRKERS